MNKYLCMLMMLCSVCAFAGKKKSSRPRKKSHKQVQQLLPRAAQISPQQRYQAEIKAAADGDYHYSSFGLADPFSKPGPAVTLAKGPGGVPNSLITYPLQNYSLVGTWTVEGGKHRALVITPEDQGIIIKDGDAIGNRQGKIVDITANTLIVRQYITSSSGEQYAEDYKLMLNED
jgi:Tfp pilus assembly protein PilP